MLVLRPNRGLTAEVSSDCHRSQPPLQYKRSGTMITVIVKRSAGNGEVGSMWHETFGFAETATLAEILEKCDYGEDIIIPAKSRQHKS